MFQPSGPGHVLSTTDGIWASTTTSESGVGIKSKIIQKSESNNLEKYEYQFWQIHASNLTNPSNNWEKSMYQLWQIQVTN